MNKKTRNAILVFALTVCMLTSSCGAVSDTMTGSTKITSEAAISKEISSEATKTETKATQATPVAGATEMTSSTDLLEDAENPASSDETELALPDWKDTPAEFMHHAIPYLGGDASTLLISAETVSVIDESIFDGIDPVKDGEKITLPVGTVVFFYDENLDPFDRIEHDTYSYTVLIDGRCIAFDTTYTEDNEIRLNGKPAAEIFDADPFLGPWQNGEPTEETTLPETEIIEEVDLGENEILDHHYKQYKKINIRVDWNEDGTTDSFSRVVKGEGTNKDIQVIYTDGATGEQTDVTDKFGEGRAFQITYFSTRTQTARRVWLINSSRVNTQHARHISIMRRPSFNLGPVTAFTFNMKMEPS
jgi:hypothetical protein